MSSPDQAPRAEPQGADSTLEGDVEPALLELDRRRRRFRTRAGMVAAGALFVLLPSCWMAVEAAELDHRGRVYHSGAAVVAGLLAVAGAGLVLLASRVLERLLLGAWVRECARLHRVAAAELARALPVLDRR